MTPEIRHIVAFTLKHKKDSAEAKQFIADSKRILGAIPSVAAFDQCYQTSPKNEFDYAFVFDFLREEDYNAYSMHPDHVQYVKERWETEVDKFMETDVRDIM